VPPHALARHVRTSTVARNVAPDSSGMMYIGSAIARFVNHAVPPVSKDGSTAMRWMARKKEMKSGACAIMGANDLRGLQSCLRHTRVSANNDARLKSRTFDRWLPLPAGKSRQRRGRPSGRAGKTSQTSEHDRSTSQVSHLGLQAFLKALQFGPGELQADKVSHTGMGLTNQSPDQAHRELRRVLHLQCCERHDHRAQRPRRGHNGEPPERLGQTRP
jgi:hypothetical protein